MTLQSILTFVFYAAGIATFLFVGKGNLRKQTIADQKELLGLKDDEISYLEDRVDQLEKRVNFLEELLSGNPFMVQPSNLPGSRRRGRGNRPDSPEVAKDREIR